MSKITFNSNVEFFKSGDFYKLSGECLRFFPSCVVTLDIMYVYDFDMLIENPFLKDVDHAIIKSYSKHDNIVIRNLSIVY
jgi:hypothetical protein